MVAPFRPATETDHTQTCAQILAQGAERLAGAGVPGPMRDARRLLAHAIDISSTRLTLVLPDPATAALTARFFNLIEQRANRQPVSQIIGTREFFGRSFRVSPDVLDPRPETELLVEMALKYPFERVLDLGTGSGCVMLSILAERPGTIGKGADISQSALDVAAENSASLGLSDRCEFLKSDWYRCVEGRFDMIVANPPYVSAVEYGHLAPEPRQWEPKIALTPGGDGLSPYRKIAPGSLCHLTPGGRLIVEIGPTQGRAVNAIFSDTGLIDCTIHKDLDGRDRVVSGRLP